MSKEKISYKVYGRIWIETEKGAFLGKGRIDLLELIKEFGSISQAAKSMKMSYRQAWELIESMNDKSKEPLVIKQTGGKNGGGAVLTKRGEKAIREFISLEKSFTKFVKQQTKKMKL